MSKLISIRGRKPAAKKQWRSIDDLNGSVDAADLTDVDSPNAQFDTEADLSRRGFMGVTLAGAAAALSGCIRKDVEYIVPQTERPEDFIPGKPAFFATSAVIAGEVHGLLAKSQDGRPIKLDGNPRHPVTQGKSSVFSQAAIMDLYDPDRSQAPEVDGAHSDWAAWDAWSSSHFGDLKRAGGKGLAFLVDDQRSPTFNRLLGDLLKAYPAAKLFRSDAAARPNGDAGAALLGLEGLRPLPNFEAATVVVALDADFLGTDGEVVRATREFSAARKVEDTSSEMSRLYVVEAQFSNTGFMADNRLRLKSSLIRGFGLALAKALFDGGLAVPAGAADVVAAIAAPALSPTEELWVQQVSKDLLAARGTALIVVGERQPASVHALANLLNAALGAVGTTVGYVPTNDLAAGTLTELVKDAGFIDTLVVVNENPVDRTAGSLGLHHVLKKIPHTVHLGQHANETAHACKWHLPTSHFLEAWGDRRSDDGTVGLQQPLIAPMFGTRSEVEVLGGLTGEGNDGRKLVMATWADGPGFETTWRAWLNLGFVDGSTEAPVAPSAGAAALAIPADGDAAPAAATAAFSFSDTAGILGGAHSPAEESPIEVVFINDPCMYDGAFTNNPWMQELPEPLGKLTWDNAAFLSPKTAASAGVTSGQMIKLELEGRNLSIPAWITPGVADDVVVLPLGRGETRSGRFAKGTGFNANSLRGADHPWFRLGVGLSKGSGDFVLATTQHHQRMEPRDGWAARPLVRENTLAEFRNTPDFVQGYELLDEHHIKSLWTEPNVTTGHQWGMTVDLNSCTGCNACAIACTAENNISTVGKERVHRGREMSWIRIDRYFTGDPDNPEVVTQPVACAHCETAPCEGVCPVQATSHTPEGLNDIAYNRCIGTRYCANNCPYKVRRFNFFNYAKENDAENERISLVRNPDVTVRFRGVIEKCTYCVQRINSAKIEGKRDGLRKVPDGRITSACQDACPASAIVFGDINDPKTQVAKLKRNPRNYAMLAELNIRPRTSFLAKLRNPNPELA